MKHLYIYMILLFQFSAVLQAQTSLERKDLLSKADSVAHRYQHHPINDLRLLAHKLTAPFGEDFLKYRAIYTWVSNNITVDYKTYQLNEIKRKKIAGNEQLQQQWNEEISRIVFANLLHHRRTLCTGYAYLVQQLCSFAQIKAVIINGFGRSSLILPKDSRVPNHSWNAIQIDGSWFMSDATWSSGYYDKRNDLFVKQFDDTYFLIEPTQFLFDHFPLDESQAYTDECGTISEFLEGPVTYRAIFKRNINLLQPSTLHNEVLMGEFFTITLKSSQIMNADKIKLKTRHRKLQTEVQQLEDGRLRLSWMPTKKGVFDIHLLIEDEYIATYTVKVTADRVE